MAGLAARVKVLHGWVREVWSCPRPKASDAVGPKDELWPRVLPVLPVLKDRDLLPRMVVQGVYHQRRPLG
jgi:hypothetical protein